MLLISETISDASLQLIEEATEGTGKKKLYIQGVFIACNRANKNGRIYPKEHLEEAVADFADKVKNGAAFGELGHNQEPRLSPERISHRITDLRWNGDDVVGKAVVLDDGMGKVLSSILRSGGKVGISTKGVGSVKRTAEGLDEVQNDYRLLSMDAVVDPSTAELAHAITEATLTSMWRHPKRPPITLDELQDTSEHTVRTAAFASYLKHLAGNRRDELREVLRPRKARKLSVVNVNPHIDDRY